MRAEVLIMAEKNWPPTFVELLKPYVGQLVRLEMSSGKQRDGELESIHDDYVVIGGFALQLCQIANYYPLRAPAEGDYSKLPIR
jgi:hypothetical protein